MRFRLTLTPESRKVGPKIEKVALSVRRRYDDAMSELADKCVVRVRKRIDMQLFVPLKEGYLIRKRNSGLDERILIATRQYYDTIEKQRIGVGRYGVKADEKKANLAEDGSPTQPPRPHWAPVVRELEREAAKLFERKVVHDLP